MRFLQNIFILMIPSIFFNSVALAEDWKINTNCLGTNKFVDGKIEKDAIEEFLYGNPASDSNRYLLVFGIKGFDTADKCDKIDESNTSIKASSGSCAGSSERHILSFNKETKEVVYVANYSHGNRKFEGKCF